MMWGWGEGHLGVGGWIGMGFMILLWIAIIVGVIYLIRHLTSQSDSRRWRDTPPREQMREEANPIAGQTSSDALRILEERYASADIERDDFLKRKADLISQRRFGDSDSLLPKL
jgi:uncharacterized membrane protein